MSTHRWQKIMLLTFIGAVLSGFYVYKAITDHGALRFVPNFQFVRSASRAGCADTYVPEQIIHFQRRNPWCMQGPWSCWATHRQQSQDRVAALRDCIPHSFCHGDDRPCSLLTICISGYLAAKVYSQLVCPGFCPCKCVWSWWRRFLCPNVQHFAWLQ